MACPVKPFFAMEEQAKEDVETLLDKELEKTPAAAEKSSQLEATQCKEQAKLEEFKIVQVGDSSQGRRGWFVWPTFAARDLQGRSTGNPF